MTAFLAFVSGGCLQRSVCCSAAMMGLSRHNDTHIYLAAAAVCQPAQPGKSRFICGRRRRQLYVAVTRETGRLSFIDEWPFKGDEVQVYIQVHAPLFCPSSLEVHHKFEHHLSIYPHRLLILSFNHLTLVSLLCIHNLRHYPPLPLKALTEGGAWGGACCAIFRQASRFVEPDFLVSPSPLRLSLSCFAMAISSMTRQDAYSASVSRVFSSYLCSKTAEGAERRLRSKCH